MKLIKFLLRKEKKEEYSAAQNTQVRTEEYFSRLGREQFKRLVDRGLGIPVAIL
ncbi:hypothetical protein BH11PAT1_BH11PAT1_4270 [soil metagenome]